MTYAAPAMSRLLALGTPGPFPEASEPRWFAHDGGTVRHLDLGGYRDGLIEEGAAARTAADIVRRMGEHGAERILWATAFGGRRGRIDVSWDARVAVLTTPAATAVPDVTGEPAGSTPPGAAVVDQLVGRPGVLTAYRVPVEPQRVRTPPPTRLARALGLKGQVRLRYRQLGYASLAVERIGATALVFAASPAAAEAALLRLVDTLLADMQEWHADRRSGGA